MGDIWRPSMLHGVAPNGCVCMHVVLAAPRLQELVEVPDVTRASQGPARIIKTPTPVSRRSMIPLAFLRALRRAVLCVVQARARHLGPAQAPLSKKSWLDPWPIRVLRVHPVEMKNEDAFSAGCVCLDIAGLGSNDGFGEAAAQCQVSHGFGEAAAQCQVSRDFVCALRSRMCVQLVSIGL